MRAVPERPAECAQRSAPTRSEAVGHCDRCKVGAVAVRPTALCGAVRCRVARGGLRRRSADRTCQCMVHMHAHPNAALVPCGERRVLVYTPLRRRGPCRSQPVRFRKPFESTERESCGGAAAPCDRIRQLKEDGPGPARPGFSSCKFAVAIHRREARHGCQRRCVQEILPHIQRLPYDAGGML